MVHGNGGRTRLIEGSMNPTMQITGTTSERMIGSPMVGDTFGICWLGIERRILYFKEA